MNIRVKRVYDPAVKADGHRVLVDRLWPRGMKKSEAQIDEWLKEIAPSTRLRKTFKHDPGRWPEFRQQYSSELDPHREELAQLARQSRTQPVTLLFAAKNVELNNAVALKEYIEQMT